MKSADWFARSMLVGASQRSIQRDRDRELAETLRRERLARLWAATDALATRIATLAGSTAFDLSDAMPDGAA